MPLIKFKCIQPGYNCAVVAHTPIVSRGDWLWLLTMVYPGRDTFEYDQGYVTKNQPITVLILLSESLAI